MRHAFPPVEVANFQCAQLLPADGVVGQRRRDGPVALALQGGRRRGLQEQPRLVVAERRRHPLAVQRARPLDPQDGVMEHGVAVA
jgi:hypothetical protein